MDLMVIYGMGEIYDGNICKKDLCVCILYNIYVINGLFLMFIVMFGEVLIYVVFNFEQSDYFYFVVSGEGGYNFFKIFVDYNCVVCVYFKKFRIK